MLIVLREAGSWWIFALIWSLAAIAMILELVPKVCRCMWAIAVYLLMGWLAVFLIEPLNTALPEGGFESLLAGGVAYTAGIVFYVLD
jgi:hemolysin III